MNKVFLFWMVGFWISICANNAYAYLDPGTGSMILQSILASFLFIGTGIGLFWNKIKNLFSGCKKTKLKKIGTGKSNDS